MSSDIENQIPVEEKTVNYSICKVLLMIFILYATFAYIYRERDCVSVTGVVYLRYASIPYFRSDIYGSCRFTNDDSDLYEVGSNLTLNMTVFKLDQTLPAYCEIC
jgi:hypothetical protein